MKKLTILLIEDNPSDIRLIKELLKEISGFNYFLMTSGSLKDACKQIDNSRVDIILLDLNLPDSLGYQTFVSVLECCGNVPIVLVSGLEDEELSLKLIQEGAQDYITKQSLNGALLGKTILYSIERRQLTKSLKISNAKYQVLFDSFPLGITLSDKEGNIIESNRKAVKLLGLSKEEQLQRQIDSSEWNIIKENGSPFPQEEYASVIALKENRVVENIQMGIVKGENDITWINVTAAPLPIENYGVAIAYNDITDRKRSEEKLARSEASLNLALETSHIGVWDINLLDNSTNRTLIHDQIFGYQTPLDSWSIKTFLGHVLPEDRNYVEKCFKEAIEKQSDWNFECRIRRMDGEIRWIHASGGHERNAKGKAFMMSVLIQDITQRKQAEHFLSESEKSLREMLESLPQLVWTCRINGQCDYLSLQWVKYTGIPEKEQLGDNWLKQLHPDDQEKTMSIWMEKVKTGVDFDIEYRLRRFDGVYRWYKVRAVPLTDLEGKIIKWFGSNNDIDDIKKAIDEIKILNETLENRVSERTEQLVAANKELETFSYSVSHDLRAPLRHISGYVSLFLENRSLELSEEDLGYLKIVTDSVSKMSELIDALLSFSRLNRAEIHKTITDTLPIIKDGLQLFDNEIKNRAVEIKINTLPKTFGDQQLISQVWVNLISNAIKYTGKKQDARIEIGSYDTENETVFFINDNGAGFNMEYASNLFIVFKRLHNSKSFDGIGIGLANIKSIIERHGGRCWAEGEIDKGATFYFSLPKPDALKTLTIPVSDKSMSHS